MERGKLKQLLQALDALLQRRDATFGKYSTSSRDGHIHYQHKIKDSTIQWYYTVVLKKNSKSVHSVVISTIQSEFSKNSRYFQLHDVDTSIHIQLLSESPDNHCRHLHV